ncbi:hypothetical protein [Hazenella coriacea]|uniref:Lipoprotein n=1 Tax=Hazenella coriacea TaxID=1179467 RepID=A0A4R3LGX6_9BACL|nr:hypothetical protein [Hazenella coriacea]TCS96766.1 hypothetical protein EDD58_101407 [Hazenella coriacea]
MKKRVLLSMLGTAIIITSACSSHSDKEQASVPLEKQAKTEVSTEVPIIEGSFDVVERYETVEDLAKKATIVIEGKVVNEDSFQSDSNTTFTKSEVIISRVIKGDVKTGDMVTFVELGGLTTRGEVTKEKTGLQLSKNEKAQPVEVVFNGVKTMKKGDKVLLFGEDAPNRKLLDQVYYFPVGMHEGKFMIHDDSASRKIDKVKNDHGDQVEVVTETFKKSELESKVRSMSK